jgi:hypothetical protein
MEAIIGRAAVGTAGRNVELALVEWLKATRRLARAALAAAGYVLVNTSRAGLLVRNGSRRRLRL